MKARKQLSAVQLQKQCDAFNQKVFVGCKVRVKRDNGGVLETITRSSAYVQSGHSAVIMVDGISGCYLLDRVEVAA